MTSSPNFIVPWSTSIPPIQLVATGGATGNPVTFSIVIGQGTLSGANNSILTVTGIGSTVIAANQAGGLVNGVYYAPATQVTQTAVVTPTATVATPTFSVAAGTYTAVQSVTISDTSVGATIHYTTNGNTPTISSPVYTAGTPISVGITTTIKAFAVLPTGGYAPSAIASATNTLKPDFVLAPYQSTFNIPAGLAGGSLISLAPLFGFDSPVTLSCSGMPAGDTCSFTPSKITALTLANGTTGYTTWTIQTASATTSAANTGKLPFLPKGPYAPAGTLAFAALLFGVRKRKRLLMALLLMLSIGGAGMMSGCTKATTVLGQSTFTLTATSGTVVHSATITLVVNNF